MFTCASSSSLSRVLLADVASLSSFLACTRASSNCRLSLYNDTQGQSARGCVLCLGGGLGGMKGRRETSKDTASSGPRQHIAGLLLDVCLSAVPYLARRESANHPA